MATQGHDLQFLGALAVGIIVGGFVGMPLLVNKNEFGLLVIAAAPVLTVCIYGLCRRRKASSHSPDIRNQRATLAGVAFVGAPLLATVVGLIGIAVSDVHPADRVSVVTTLAVLGLVAGTVVGAALLVSSSFK